MAATVRQWEAIIERLGQLDGAGTWDAGSLSTKQAVALNNLLVKVRAQPAAPKALWKKLVQQQVPLRLLQACTQHLQSFEKPNHAAATAAMAAGVLIDAACSAGVVVRGHQVLSGAALLQLQQSGLLEQLPAALPATTQELQRAVDSAEAGQLDDISEAALQSMGNALLHLSFNLLCLPPEHNNGVPFVPLPAIAGLILSSLRYLTCLAAAEAAGQQQQQQGEWRLGQIPHWLVNVKSAILMLLHNMSVGLYAFQWKCYTAGSSSSSSVAAQQMTAAAVAAVEEMLCSEECLLCLAVSNVALALPLTAPQLMGDGSSSGSSSGNSGSGDSGGSSASGSNSGGGNASRQAGQQPQAQAAGCLPPQLMAVLQQAGCSADIIVQFARLAKHDTAVLEFEKAVKIYNKFIEAHEEAPGLLQDREPPQLGRFALLHKLTSSALLQLAVQLASFGLPRLRCCSRCCVAALSSLQEAQGLEQLAAPDSDSGGSGSPDQPASDEQQQGSVYSSCLQSVQDLLQQLLQLWGSATAVLTAADVQSSLRLPEDSSSSSSGSSNQQASVQALLQGADGPVVLRCISCSINVLSAALLPELLDCHGASGGGQVELTNVWLCSLLSWQARMSIEAVQASGSSSTVALRQSGQLLASTLQAAAADLLHALLATNPSIKAVQLVNIALRVGDPPRSLEQPHLLDFLCSLLKLCSIDSSLLQQQPGVHVAGILGVVSGVADIAAARATWLADFIRDSSSAAQAAAAAPPASGAAAAAPAAEQDTAAAVAGQGSSSCCPSPTAMLPWLVLLGRCCLLWARWLQQLSAVDVAAAQQQLAEQQASQVPRSTWRVIQEATAAADPWLYMPGESHTTFTPASELHGLPARSGGTKGLSTVIHEAAASASTWLKAGSNMQQLADLGYNNLQPLQAALVQLQADAAATETAQHDPTTQQSQTDADHAAAEAILIAERTALIGLCPQLQAVGEALTAFAFPLSCNNPGCVNASGPSEAKLVGGKACVCGGCLTARYCSRACLKQHWKVHKPICKALAAATTTAAGGRAPAAVNTPASG